MKTSKKPNQHLTDDDIQDLLGILDAWTDKLTWDFLIAELQRRWKRRYSRQALERHDRVKLAFDAAKSRLRGAPGNSKRQGPVELSKAREQKMRLEAKLERLERENAHLMEKFVRWAYNAHQKGLTEQYLDTPLGIIDREPTNITRI